MSSINIKRKLTYGIYYLAGFFAIPFVLNHYNVSYDLTITILHMLLILLLFYTLYQYRNLDKMYETNLKYNENREKLLLKENELNSLFDNNNAYLWTLDFSNKTFMPSQGFENVYGYSRDDFLANYELWKDRVIPEDMHIAEEHYAKLKSGLPSNRSFRFRNKDGEVRWLDAWGKPIFNKKMEVSHLTGVAYDITENKKLEEKLYYNANHDYLTGLPNRKQLIQYMEDEINNCDGTNQSLAVLFLDLDRFKFINDSYGHNTGDKLLIEIGCRLKGFVGDKGMVSRHGGDEFIIIMKYHAHEQFIQLVNGIIDTFKTPYDLKIENSIVSASIGISLYPKDDTTLEGLVGQADRAMYRAKSQGKNTYRFANSVLEEAEIRKNNIEQHLKKALQLNEFQLYYQPIVNLETDEFLATEALIRWKNPHLGMVLPLEFIPLAESQGIISDIGLWVIDEAIKQNKKWQYKGIDIGLSVNVSNIQFEDPLFSQKVSTILTNNQFKAEKLTIEITESTIQNTKKASKTILRLRNMGIQIAIDDFGTGYSSLSVLNSLSIDTIKIDRSFIFNILENQNNAQLVKTIISLGNTLKCKVVAEGIENHEQAVFLEELGCIYGQGYLYSRPASSEDIEDLILKQHT